MPGFTPAPEVEAIAQKLINKHHTDLWNVRVEYLFRTEAQMKGTKVQLGSASKVSGKNALLATSGADHSEGLDFFVMEIARDYWQVMSPKQRIALVDHELCHMLVTDGPNDEIKLSIRSHDIEEFAEVLERHGPWKADVITFMKRATTGEQLSLLADAVAEMEGEQPADMGGRQFNAPRGDELMTPALLHAAATLMVKANLGSTSMIQRKLKIGFALAGRIVDELTDAGVLGPARGSQAREVLLTPEELATWKPPGDAAAVGDEPF